MTPSEELEQILAKRERAVEEAITNLFAEFMRKSPVDTGAFRTAWEIKKTAGGYKITNDMEYATILYDGRQLVQGKWFGSEQWPEGGAVMLDKYNRDLQSKLDRI